MTINPFHDSPREPQQTDVITVGSICVINKSGLSSAQYLLTATHDNEFECYEVVSKPLEPVSNIYTLELSSESILHINLAKSYYFGVTDIVSVQQQLNDDSIEKILRALVQQKVGQYSKHKFQPKAFVSEQSPVPVSGKVLGDTELHNMVDASLDAWLTTGRFNDQFEQRLAEFIGVKHVLTVNSGSSANLLALTALTSPKLGDRALKKGDEVIAVAAGFPTTVNPILQNGLVPVFVDITLPSYNIDVSQLEAALSDKTRAIMLAHTLGNTFDIDAVMSFARQHNLWVIEDCCDALGTTYTSAGETKHVGTFGDIATMSFYPAHHITMGEGGAVYTNNGKLKLLLESFRDWGRDCFCPPGHDNTCKKRFSYQLGQLPCGYDHKYTYSHVGYNLKISDMQAAVALAQMDRLEDFIAQRKANFQRLYDGLKPLSEYLLLPEAQQHADPSWFGFAITLKQGNRTDFIQHLEQYRIANRLVFGGNLIKQPYFADQHYRVVGDLNVTDEVMNKSLWIGVFPGLKTEMIDYMINTITRYFEENHD